MVKLADLICVCEDVSVDEYVRCMNIVRAGMEYPEWLGDFSRDTLIDVIDSGAKIWMYYMDDEFVCSMMLIPTDSEDILKLGLNVDYRELIEYGPMFVNPKYVGNGLQYQMLLVADEYCVINGYKYAVGTIHPDNGYSINNLVKDRFELASTREFARGIRGVYVKKLENVKR